MTLAEALRPDLGIAPQKGRRMTARLRVRGWLELESAVHIGGSGGRRGRMELASDGLGRAYLPGTGLAGALRSFDPGDGTDGNGWGYITVNTQAGRASRIVVYDAILCTTDRLDSHGWPDNPADEQLSIPVDGILTMPPR